MHFIYASNKVFKHFVFIISVKMPLKDHPEGKCHYTATRFEEAHFGEKDGPKGHIT